MRGGKGAHVQEKMRERGGGRRHARETVGERERKGKNGSMKGIFYAGVS